MDKDEKKKPCGGIHSGFQEFEMCPWCCPAPEPKGETEIICSDGTVIKATVY